MFEADPYKSNLAVTPFILSHLQPMPAIATCHEPSNNTLHQRLSTLPNELRELVYESLAPFVDPSPECSRLFPSQAWLDLLHEDEVLPWLYELDLSECREADAKEHKGQPVVWDWELLIRQLSQPDAFEATGAFAGAPLGLRNRRRIWRCLSDMDFKGAANDMEGGWEKYTDEGSECPNEAARLGRNYAIGYHNH